MKHTVTPGMADDDEPSFTGTPLGVPTRGTLTNATGLPAVAGPTRIGVQIVHDGVPLPGNPRESGQWTRGGLVLWIPGDTLAISRWTNCSLVSMARIVTADARGFQVALHPHAAGIVKIALLGEADNYFSYDPPRPGPVPT